MGRLEQLVQLVVPDLGEQLEVPDCPEKLAKQVSQDQPV